MLQGALRKLLGIGETVGKAAIGAAPMAGAKGMAKGAMLGAGIGGAGKMLPQAKKALPMLPHNGQYAQYMNSDGTGGGFGPNNPSAPNPTRIPYNNGFYAGAYNHSLPVINPQQLQVQQNNGMQTYGPRQEDDYTAAQAIQPVSYNNGQVSLNGGLMQGSNRSNRYNQIRF